MKEQLSKIFGFNDKHQVDEVQQVSVNQIRPNPYQPRTVFEDERLAELAQTIKTHGVIQPIVVRIRDDMFEIIAGERRWRAVKKLGLETIPVIVREFNDAQSASTALIENLQREGLTAIEEASAYKRLMELHNLTQESLAQRLGKGQSTIANKIRLLHSTEEVKQALLERKISERHARALLSVEDEENQNKLLNEIIEMQLTIKQTETRIPFYNGEYKRKAKKRISFTRDIRLAVNTIRESLGIIKKSGIKIETEEHESEEYLQIVVKIPKK